MRTYWCADNDRTAESLHNELCLMVSRSGVNGQFVACYTKTGIAVGIPQNVRGGCSVAAVNPEIAAPLSAKYTTHFRVPQVSDILSYDIKC